MAIQQTRRALAPGHAHGVQQTSAQPRHYRGVHSKSPARHNGKDRLATGLGWFSIGLGVAQILAPRGLSRMIGLAEDHSVLMRLLGAREITSGIGILTQKRPAGALWSRVAGDAMDLSLLGRALASDGSDKGRVLMAAAAVVGVMALDVRAASKQTEGGDKDLTRVQTVTINRPAEELYRFWRNFQNLPQFMSHLESVQVSDDKRSHWVAKAPAGMTVEWDAEITEDRPNELIAWRSVEGSDVENSGYIRFQPAPGGRGTEVRVEVVYDPPGGAVGATIARLFGEEPGQQIKGDLYRFKQLMETGEVIHSDSSIHKGMHPAKPSDEA